MSVEAEADPAVTTGAQFDLPFRFGWHLHRIENEKLLALLIADPQFRLIRCEGGAMSAMRDRLLSSEHTMRHFTRLKVYDIKAHVLPQTNIGKAVLAIDRKWKDAKFSNSFESARDAI